MVEMVREPGEMMDRGTVDSPVRPVHEAIVVKIVVHGCIIPGGGLVLSTDRLLMEIWSVKRREEHDS